MQSEGTQPSVVSLWLQGVHIEDMSGSLGSASFLLFINPSLTHIMQASITMKITKHAASAIDLGSLLPVISSPLGLDCPVKVQSSLDRFLSRFDDQRLCRAEKLLALVEVGRVDDAAAEHLTRHAQQGKQIAGDIAGRLARSALHASVIVPRNGGQGVLLEHGSGGTRYGTRTLPIIGTMRNRDDNKLAVLQRTGQLLAELGSVVAHFAQRDAVGRAVDVLDLDLAAAAGPDVRIGERRHGADAETYAFKNDVFHFQVPFCFLT